MGNPCFRFKQFTVRQQHSAMKVGTDGVLLGAWADVSGVRRALDVGTGTGLIALMLAQRSEAKITGIDHEPECYEEAGQNFEDSPWAGRLESVLSRYQEFVEREYGTGLQFDLIISNPPYFKNAKQPANRARAMARHSSDLSFSDLMDGADKLLKPHGRLAVIYPADDFGSLIEEAEHRGFFAGRICWIIPLPGVRAKRVLLEFSRIRQRVEMGSLVVESGGRHQYSDQYRELTRDFYLDF